jgi:large subunit ribosomal protein L10
MKLTKEQKTGKSKELATVLKGASHLYITEYQGLKFKEMDQLRADLKKVGCTYKVLKNSVLEHALKAAGVDGASRELLDGPNALLMGEEDDPVSSAKILMKFSKENDKLKLKGGYVEGKWLDSAECAAMSKIGTKPELQAKLASVLYSCVGQSVWVLAAPIRDLVLVLKALEGKKKSEAAA